MEFLPFNPEHEGDKPETTGDLETPKKKRRKTRIPKKLIESAEAKEKKSKAQDKKAEESAEPVRHEVAEVQTEPAEHEEPLVLPEVEETESEEPEYEGELVIDHADDLRQTTEDEPAQAETSADNFEQLLDAEADSAEAEPEAPPIVAPPLPFIMQARPIPQAEVEAAPSTDSFEQPILPVPPVAPATSRLRGRLAEEWASRRRPIEEPMVSETEANRRSLRAEKRGLSRGVVTGGLVGYLVGRRGKRANEREAQKVIAERDKTIKALAAERDSARTEATERMGILKRTQNELGELMRRAQTSVIEKRASAPKIETTRVVEVPLQPVTIEKTEAEAKPAGRSFEAPVLPVVKLETAKEAPKPKLEPAPERQPITQETYLPPEGRRVEMSAWHRIEVDEKTGRPVENPSVEYGEAFKREQKQEKLAHDAAKVQTAAQVGMTILSGGSGAASASPAMPSKETSPTPASQKIATFTRTEIRQAVRQVSRNVTSPLTWVAAFTLVVILFVTGIIH